MKVLTACPLDCFDACSVIANVDDKGKVTLEGNPEHPITRGSLCNRGRRLSLRRDSDDRVLTPLKKVNGKFQAISWEQALTEISGEIRQSMEAYGHHAIFHCYDWGSGAVLKNLNQRFFYQLGGCTETVGSLCWDAGLQAQIYDFGLAASHAPEDMADNSEAIVIWGRNVANTNVHMVPFIKEAQRRGAQLVVVSPLEQDIARRADLCVYPRPGSDAALALGVLRICRDEGWLDEDFLQYDSVGWASLDQSLDAYTLDEVTRLTDVDADTLWQLAQIYGRTKPVATILGLGLQRYAGGGNAVRAIDALVAATGHVGVAGGGVNYAQRGMAAFFDEDALTGRSAADVRTFERTTQAEEILAAELPIQVMFVTRTNPVVQVPDAARLREAYGSIRCKVVIDTFMTQTAMLADYVLPCTNVLEEEDVTFTTMWHGYVNRIQPVFEPRGEAKPEWLIFQELARELGMTESMEGTVDDWLDRILRPMGEERRNELKEAGTTRLPVARVPWSDKSFLTPSGKFEFASSRAVEDGQFAVATCIPLHAMRHSKDQVLPYHLLTTHPRKNENSQREEVEWVQDVPVVELSKEIAMAKAIESGDRVRVFNRKASIEAYAKISSSGHARTVRLESGWWGQGVTINDFTDMRKADFASQAAVYDCLCDVEKV